MLHLENDMDDLFKKAAANYPLKPGDSDWESVAKKVTGKDNSQATPAPAKGRNNKKIFLLLVALLLFISGGITYKLLVSGDRSQKAGTGTSVANAFPQKQNNTPVVTEQPMLQKTEISKDNRSGVISAKVKTVPNKSLIATNYQRSDGNNFSELPNADNELSNPAHDKRLIAVDKEKSIPVTGSSNSLIDHFGLFTKKVNAPALKTVDKKITASSQKLKNNFSIKEKGFYIGAVMGPDFSKVETGSFGNTGFYAGIIAGYQFNKTFSLEAGFSWNKKYYASDGKYFSMDKIRSTMPSGMVINNLESRASLFEIPVRAKINFLNKANANLFVTGGVSAYLMAKEKNLFYATVNGTQEKVSATYENNSGFPAVAGFSAGYEHNFLKSLKIRIEPYLKIPLQGMGIGKLPVTSAGIQIGITGHLK